MIMQRKLAIVPVLVLLGFALVVTQPATAAVYLKIDGVEGDATAADKDHQGWIVVESLSTSMNVAPSHTGTGSGETRRRGDAIVEDVSLTKYVDRASAKLAEAVCKGKVIPKVEIHVTASYTEAGRQTYYRYELKNVRVTSYNVSGSAGADRPVENFSLNFEEIKVEYDQSGAEGMGALKSGVESEDMRAGSDPTRAIPVARFESDLATQWKDECRRGDVVTVLDTSMVPHGAKEFRIEGRPATQTASIYCDAKGENKSFKDCYSCNSSVPADVPYAQACDYLGFCTEGYNGNSSYCSFP
jgi:type VI secretion system secreted protein Hcp